MTEHVPADHLLVDSLTPATEPERASDAVAGWRIIAASVPGTGHAARGQSCQDASAYQVTTDGVLVAAVCDGAGSAALGEIGAQVVAQAAVACCADTLAGRGRDPGSVSWLTVLRNAAGAARDALFNEAARREVAARELATTLLLVLASGERVTSLQIGDGAVVASGSAGEVVGVTTPQRSEYINETTFLTSPGAIDGAQLGEWNGRVTGIALTTDGLQLLALDLTSGKPHPPFFRPLFAHVREADDLKVAAEELETLLASPRVTSRTDDDLTLLLAARAPA